MCLANQVYELNKRLKNDKKGQLVTLYIKYGQDCSKFSSCSPLINHCGLISLKPAIAQFVYTYHYVYNNLFLSIKF